MVLTADMPNAQDIEVRDAKGRMINGLIQYCTESKQAKLYLFDNSKCPVVVKSQKDKGLEVAIATVTLEGSYAVCKKTGKIIK